MLSKKNLLFCKPFGKFLRLEISPKMVKHNFTGKKCPIDQFTEGAHRTLGNTPGFAFWGEEIRFICQYGLLLSTCAHNGGKNYSRTM